MSLNNKDVSKTVIPEIQHNVNLRPYNTLNVEAFADRFVAITAPDQLTHLYEQNQLEEDSWVLGGGSNVLFKGRVKNLVLKNEIRFLEAAEESDREIRITIGGGNDWHLLVKQCVEKGWGGIENLALIPGTVGAAPIQNIGAYGVELKDVFVSLSAFDLKTGRQRIFNSQDCEFGYRDSVFKKGYKGRFIILSVTLKLTKPPHAINSHYKSLKEWLENKHIHSPGIDDIFRGVVEIRTGKLPNPADLGNAGSFFKNPVLPASKLDELKNEYESIPSFPADEGMVKIPAGWLIEKTGWKGKRVGNVGTYENQALVIVNHGGATGDEIWALAVRIRESVREQFGIELVPEVNVIGSSS